MSELDRTELPTSLVDREVVREAILLSRKAGNYVFLPIFVAGLLVLLTLQDRWNPRDHPDSAIFGYSLASVVVAAFVLWRLSRQPKPPLLFACGIAISLTTACSLVLLFKTADRTPTAFDFLHIGGHAIGMAGMAMHCFRMWSKLKRFEPEQIEETIRAAAEGTTRGTGFPSALDEPASPGSETVVSPKVIAILVLAVVAIAWGMSWHINDKAMAARDALLRGTAQYFGLKSESPSAVWGVIMERGTPEGTDSFLILLDGRIGLWSFPQGEYRGPTGDSSGLQGAIKDFLQIAANHSKQGTPIGDGRMPRDGELLFYLLSDEGSRVLSAMESDLRNGNSLSPLYRSGERLALKLQSKLPMPGVYTHTDPPRFYRACDFKGGVKP